MKELDIVIEEIIKQYSIINDCLKQANFYSPMNLKRKTVGNIYGDDDFYIYISKLRDYLNDIITESSNSIINCQSSYRVTTRVKTLNSIQYKIRNYYLNHENGNIPIKKCLNDIFGIRIILKENINYNIIKYINETFPKIKVIDSSKMDYKAIHIYFGNEIDNTCFQWELQLWYENDEQINLKSHNIYKQDYVKWEKEKGDIS